MDWAYWSSNKGTFRPTGDGTYEVVVLVSFILIRFWRPPCTNRERYKQSPPELPLPVTNTKVGDQDAYATSDLVAPHPTQPGLWKVVGRADEQIILSNGEKTNPVPLGQSSPLLPSHA